MYSDDHANCPIETFISHLDRKAVKDKDSRIQLKQFLICCSILKRFGTRAKSEYVKFICGDIWELRCGNNRILFSVWESKILLLHNFVKKSKRTPQREKKQAERELNNWINKHGR